VDMHGDDGSAMGEEGLTDEKGESLGYRFWIVFLPSFYAF
jgi:hypothetical protein